MSLEKNVIFQRTGWRVGFDQEGGASRQRKEHKEGERKGDWQSFLGELRVRKRCMKQLWNLNYKKKKWKRLIIIEMVKITPGIIFTYFCLLNFCFKFESETEFCVFP